MTEHTLPAEPDESLDSLIGRLADEFLARRDRGEDPDPEEYAARYPDVADDIRGALAALVLAADPLDGPTADPPPAALGDFRIVRELGRGGMGVVYEAEQSSLRRRVALKVLPFAAVMDPRQLQRFKNEALAAAGLDHPHVVKVYGVGQDRGVHYIAMQLVGGRPLCDSIRDRRGESPGCGPPGGAADPTRTHTPDPTPGPADVAGRVGGPARRDGSGTRTPVDAGYARRVAGWGADAADALEHAHALGVVHRDVKPGNLLVDGRGCVYVADFGLARMAAEPGVTGTGDLLGTPRYMSPEQAAARHNLVDHRSDVYSLGATLYELLTLEPAVPGTDRIDVLKRIADTDPTPPRKLDRRVPRDLETVVMKCLEKDPARRYQSARELAADLRRWLAGKPVRAKRPRLRERAGRWVARHPRTAAAVVVAVAALIGAAVAWDRQRAAADGAARRTADEATDLWVTGRRPEALVTARRAADFLPRRGDPAVRRAVTRLLAILELVTRLEDVRLEQASRSAEPADRDSARRLGQLYREAFLAYGVDVLGGDEAAAARALREYVFARGELTLALEDWAVVEAGAAERGRLERLADRVDDFGRNLRQALRGKDPGQARKAILKDARAADLAQPGVVLLTARYREAAGLTADADRSLREGYANHPGDLWINLQLARSLSRRPRDGAASAVEYYRAAVAVRPASGHLWSLLGTSLLVQRRPEEAARAYRRVIDLGAGTARTHFALGVAEDLFGVGSAGEARFRRAIELRPDLAEAHFGLAHVLLRHKQLAGAVAEYRRGHELGRGQEGWPYPSAEWVRRAELLVKLSEDVPGLLTPARSGASDVNLKTRLLDAVRPDGIAFETQPSLADLAWDRRYEAARAATRASAHRERYAEVERALLRREALDCLRDELDKWSFQMELNRDGTLRALRGWQTDGSLAEVREEAHLSRLPGGERVEWGALWVRVGALIGQVGPTGPDVAPPPRPVTR